MNMEMEWESSVSDQEMLWESAAPTSDEDEQKKRKEEDEQRNEKKENKKDEQQNEENKKNEQQNEENKQENEQQNKQQNRTEDSEDKMLLMRPSKWIPNKRLFEQLKTNKIIPHYVQYQRVRFDEIPQYDSDEEDYKMFR